MSVAVPTLFVFVRVFAVLTLCAFSDLLCFLCAQTARRGMCSHRGLAAGALSVALGTRVVARGRRPVCTRLNTRSPVRLSSRVFQCSERARVRCIERRDVPRRCNRAHYSAVLLRHSRSYYLIRVTPDTLTSVFRDWRADNR